MERAAEANQNQPTYGYMRQKELMKLVPFSAATLWRMVKAGTFVKPVKLTERITAWNRADVQAWLLAKEGKDDYDTPSPKR